VAHKILFIIGRRTTDMTHVHGVDDGHGYGVFGESNRRVGVAGSSKMGHGVHGQSTSGTGVFGESDSRVGVAGSSNGNIGVYGQSDTGLGVAGHSDDGYGVIGRGSKGVGVNGESATGTGIFGYGGSGSAAFLNGRVDILGRLHKSGGSFKIDHPLYPANKYLYHSFVESPDMKNIYDGVVALDDKGEAEIDLPDWFAALNKDFRYQLTAIGAPGPNLYIAEEISDTTTTDYTRSNNNNSRFKVGGGSSGMKVSWQVTGIRKDPWANANRIQVEEEKPDKERGYYIYPDLYDQPEEKGISHLLFPKDKREVARAAHK
jgi:hypothetical protein